MEYQHIKACIEGILFASGEPILLSRIAKELDITNDATVRIVRELADDCRREQRGIRVYLLEEHAQMVSAPDFADIIRSILEERKPSMLSKAALEVLCVAAYHQPVTKGDVERIRGIDSSNTVSILLEKGLLEEAGRLDVPGKPMQYKTSPLFLRAFALTSLSDLPDLNELAGQLSLDASFNSGNNDEI